MATNHIPLFRQDRETNHIAAGKKSGYYRRVDVGIESRGLGDWLTVNSVVHGFKDTQFSVGLGYSCGLPGLGEGLALAIAGESLF
jgi:hypothetical protein